MSETEILMKILQQMTAQQEPDYLAETLKVMPAILGTAIGGVIGYCTASKTAETNFESQRQAAETDAETRLLEMRSHRDLELRREYGLKRTEMFNRILDDFCAFSQSLANYAAIVKNAVFAMRKGPLDYKEKQQLDQAEAKFRDSFLQLLSCESILLALGHRNLADNLRTFGKECQKFFQETDITTDLDIEKINLSVKSMQQERTQILSDLSEREQKWWVEEQTADGEAATG